MTPADDDDDDDDDDGDDDDDDQEDDEDDDLQADEDEDDDGADADDMVDDDNDDDASSSFISISSIIVILSLSIYLHFLIIIIISCAIIGLAIQHHHQPHHPRMKPSHIPSMPGITPDTCRMMPVKRGMQKLPFFPDIRRPKRQFLQPQHAEHHPGRLQDDAGEAGDAKAAFFPDI